MPARWNRSADNPYVAVMAQSGYILHPIGHISSPLTQRYDAPRQGVLTQGSEAVLRLLPGHNFEQALEHLPGFERIWLLYVFHLNAGWKPRVNVPRHRGDKVSVFAPRAPYRPNPIGLSCVRLLGVHGLELRLAECDLLDGTPVLDIKPYLPYADSFPDSGTGWVPDAEILYTVHIDPGAQRRMNWLAEHTALDLRPFVQLQLEARPERGKRKRISADSSDPTGRCRVLARRTWRIRFTVDESSREVRVLDVFSCYNAEQLADDDDPHRDKNTHRAFIAAFGADAGAVPDR